MALTTSKTIYINGTSRKGEEVLANFNASLSENGQININETVMNDSDIVETDFDNFRKLAKTEFDNISDSKTVDDSKPVADTVESDAIESDKTPATDDTLADSNETDTKVGE